MRNPVVEYESLSAVIICFLMKDNRIQPTYDSRDMPGEAHSPDIKITPGNNIFVIHASSHFLAIPFGLGN